MIPAAPHQHCKTELEKPRAQEEEIQCLPALGLNLIKTPALAFHPKVTSASDQGEGLWLKTDAQNHGTAPAPLHGDPKMNAVGPRPHSFITGNFLSLLHVSKAVYLFISLEEKYSANQRYH